MYWMTEMTSRQWPKGTRVSRGLFNSLAQFSPQKHRHLWHRKTEQSARAMSRRKKQRRSRAQRRADKAKHTVSHLPTSRGKTPPMSLRLGIWSDVQTGFTITRRSRGTSLKRPSAQITRTSHFRRKVAQRSHWFKQ